MVGKIFKGGSNHTLGGEKIL